MAAFCNVCGRYVNQYCDRCGGSAGITSCDIFGCKGTMTCPLCGNAELSVRKKVARKHKETSSKENESHFHTSGYGKDFTEAKSFNKRKPWEEEKKTGLENLIQKIQTESQGVKISYKTECPSCGYPIKPTWKYCPECGIRFSTLEPPKE